MPKQQLQYCKDITQKSNYTTDVLSKQYLYEEDYLYMLAQKIAHSQFKKKIISPFIQPSKKYNQDFAIITSQQWHQIITPNQQKIPVFIFGLHQYYPISNQNIITDRLDYVFAQKQFQIVFQTQNEGNIFVGYLPQNIELIKIIRFILFQMNLIQTQQSKIALKNKQSYHEQYFKYYFGWIIKDINDSFIHVTKVKDRRKLSQQIKQTKTMNSIQEQNNCVQKHPLTIRGQQIYKTISTGASTPITFSPYESQRNDFQSVYMFRQKNRQQIMQMKKRGQGNSNKKDLIKINEDQDEQQMNKYLVILSNEILRNLNSRKMRKNDLEQQL